VEVAFLSSGGVFLHDIHEQNDGMYYHIITDMGSFYLVEVKGSERGIADGL